MRNFILIIAVLCIMCSCSDNTFFKATITIDKAETPLPMRIFFMSDSGFVQREKMFDPTQPQPIEFMGGASSITMVNVMGESNRLLFSFPIQNGDEIEVTFNPNDPYALQIEGSKVAEKWCEWINNHNEMLSNRDERLDDEIKKYIAENPDNVVSTLLLMNFYSDITRFNDVDSLLLTISTDARPPMVVQSYQAIHGDVENKIRNEVVRLSTIIMHNSKGDFSTFFNSSGKCSVLYFWRTSDSRRKAIVDSLKSLKKHYDKRLQVADVIIDTDTTTWRRNFTLDSTNWEHYWVPGPLMSPNLQRYKIVSSPTLLVADSLGNIKYQGPSAQSAISTVRDVLKPRAKYPKK